MRKPINHTERDLHPRVFLRGAAAIACFMGVAFYAASSEAAEGLSADQVNHLIQAGQTEEAIWQLERDAVNAEGSRRAQIEKTIDGLRGYRADHGAPSSETAPHLVDEYVRLLGGIFSCSEQYSTCWAMARALIRKPLDEGADPKAHFAAMEEVMKKQFLVSEPDSKEKKQVYFSFKRLYYLALFESKQHFSKDPDFSVKQFSEDIISAGFRGGGVTLSPEQKEFHEKLTKTISGLSYLATKFNNDCSSKPDTTNLDAEFEAARIELN